MSYIILALFLILNDFENFPFFGSVKSSWKNILQVDVSRGSQINSK